MKYKFIYKSKKAIFWKTKLVVGHGIEYYEEKILNPSSQLLQINRKPQNSMVLYFEDGSLERIAEWDKYDMKLGTDWVLAIKKQMEKETGTDVKLSL